MAFRKWEFETSEYRHTMQADQAWRCPLCGELFTGDRLPGECPVCLAPERAFIRLIPDRRVPSPAVARGPACASWTNGARKDENQWNTSIKRWRLWEHPRPA